jgi:uncharacterized phiE125 gp8 family phage protein
MMQPIINLTTVTAPALEPVTLQEAKDHLRVDSTAADAEIEPLIVAARQYVERTRGIALISTVFDWFMDEWPEGSLMVPRPPLSSVTHVKYYDAAGALQTLATSVYQVDTGSKPGRIALAEGQTWPTLQSQKLSAVQVRFTAGWGAAATTVPRPIIQAMLLLIGHFYEHRGIASAMEVKMVPMAVDALLAPWADVRF